MAFHGGDHLILFSAGRQVQHDVQRVELEVVAVRLTFGRRRPTPADLAEIVAALFGAIGARFLGEDALRQLVIASWQVEDVEDNPVDACAAWRIGIVADQPGKHWHLFRG